MIRMQKILLLILLLFSSALSAQKTTAASVFFDSDQFSLSPSACRELDSLAARLLAAPDYTLFIEAYTDDQGTREYNERLATSRANTVWQYLTDKGLPPDKASVKSWGEENPGSVNDTEENRRQNRRVDIRATPLLFSGYAELQKRLSSNTDQVLTIQPGREEKVIAAGGTLIVVPAQAFVFADGTSPEGPVELIVREAYSASDFILHNLTTLSDGKILQTGGMVYLGARSEGRPLQLAEGAALTVALPTSKPDPAMELFYGQTDSTGSLVNWQPAGQKFRKALEEPKVTLDIDPALGARIMAIKIPEREKPVVPSYAGEMPPKARQPIMPYKPRAPKKPVWESVQKIFGGGNGEKMSKKDAKKAEAYYAEAMAKYQRDSLEYTRLNDRYWQNNANYEAAQVQFSKDQEYWRQELARRVVAIREYEQDYFLFQYSEALPLALRRIGKNIRRYENYSNLETAVHQATLNQIRILEKETGSGSESVSDLYEKYIGDEAMKHSDDFKYAAESGWRFHTSVSPMWKSARDLLAATAVPAISDSLKAEIQEKRMLLYPNADRIDNAMRSYIASVPRLGWINCDRFYDNPGERVQLAVQETEEAAMYVLCRNLNSLLPLARNGEKTYMAGGLPKGLDVSVIAIKIIDGVPCYARHDTKTGIANALKLNYRSLSMRDLREELKKLNI